MQTPITVGIGLALGFLLISQTLLSFPNSRKIKGPNDSVAGSIKQSFSLSGKVTDEKGMPLPGVSVTEKGTVNGVTTDGEGNFKLNVAGEKATLVFNYVGYKSIEISINGQHTIKVTLFEESKSLNEVVVIGYGTQRKKDLTGSITSIGKQDLAGQPVPDAGQAIEGKAAGVQVISSGSPGANSAIQIRGLGSINDSSPLLVIDGVPTPGGINYLNTLNTNDIATIDILKDASSSAIYGSQGANGVIIVTTKKGSSGQNHLEANIYAGVQSVAKKLELLNAAQFATLNNEELTNANQSTNPAYSNPTSLGAGTNWLNAILKKAPIQSYSLSFSGGTDKSDYYVSGSVFDQQGVVIDSKYRRYSIQINTSQKLLGWLKTGNTLTLGHDEKPNGGGTVTGALASNPVLPVLNPDGSYSGPIGQSQWYGSQTNPVGLYNLVQNNTNGYNIIGSVYAEATILPGLSFKSSPGLTATFYDTRSWVPENNLQPSPQTQSFLSESYNKSITYNWDNYITYDKRFGEDHHLNLLAGTSAEANQYNTIFGNISGFASDITQQLSNGTVQPNIGGTGNEWSLFSLMGRVNYTYKDRYLFTGTIRRDGSSRFGDNKKYGTFPSASVAWRISKESFFKDLSFFDDVKIRAGYGTTGNQNGIGNYTFASGLTSAVYVFNGNVVPIELAQNAANPNLSWETIKSTNVGLDATFLRQRINVTVDGYIKNTIGMLVPYTLPISTGYTVSPPVNAGKVQNKGVEITVTSRNLVGDLKWNTNFNISFNNNKIISLDQNSQLFPQGSSIGLNGYLAVNKVGYPINSFYGYVTQGIFQTNYDVLAHATQTGAAPGDLRFKDLNNDGVINDQDRTVIGNPNPKFIYAMNNTLSYKGIDLSISLQGTYGNEIFNANNILLEAMSGANNQVSAVLGRWEGPGTSNNIPRAVFGDPNGNSQNSDRYVENGSYLRIRNITLGYNLPQLWAQRIKFSSIRIFASAENVFTFTKYTGIDPEVGLTGIDNNVYPLTRTISLGLNLSL